MVDLRKDCFSSLLEINVWIKYGVERRGKESVINIYSNMHTSERTSHFLTYLLSSFQVSPIQIKSQPVLVFPGLHVVVMHLKLFDKCQKGHYTKANSHRRTSETWPLTHPYGGLKSQTDCLNRHGERQLVPG